MNRTRTDLTTKEAAQLVGIAESAFHEWAKRRAVTALRQIRLGRATVNLWDADTVLAATTTTPRTWRKEKPSR